MKDDRLDLNEFINTFNKKRKTLLRVFIIVFMIFSIYTLFIYEKKYKSKIVFLPSISTNSILNSRLGGVASLAGINFVGKTQKNISPELYLNILNSNTFLNRLSNSVLTVSNDKGNDVEFTYREYYKRHNSESVLSKIKSAIGLNKRKKLYDNVKNNEIKNYSYQDINIFKSLQKSINFNYDSEENLVTIESSLSEALASSELLLNIVNLLKEDLSIIKTSKLDTELEFIEKRYKEKLIEFKKIQQDLANFEDRNQYLKGARSKIHLMNLRTSYDLLFNICSELQKQVETKKIQLKENSLYITVIEPITVPIEKSGLRKSLMLSIGILLSFFIVFIYIFIEDFFLKIKSRSI